MFRAHFFRSRMLRVKDVVLGCTGLRVFEVQIV